MLYPIHTIQFADAQANISPAFAGSLTVIPFSFTQTIEIVVTQTGYTQDYSLRVWISKYRDGIPIGQYWVANKIADQRRVLYGEGMTPPDGGIALEVGDYYINILNVTLATTTFSFVATSI